MLRRQAFTLMELLIVIVIMGVVYMLAVENLARVTQTEEEPSVTIEGIKSFLGRYAFEDNVRLVCISGCKECKVIIDDKEEREIEALFGKDIRIYSYDPLAGITEKELEPYFNQNGVEEDVCFSYRFFKNGVGEQILIDDGNKVYDLGAYFSVGVYETLDEVSAAKEAVLQKVLQ